MNITWGIFNPISGEIYEWGWVVHQIEVNI
jgi:hypothetical protein